MRFQFTFTLSEQDYYQFNRYHNRNTPYAQKQQKSLRLLTGSMLLLIFSIAGIFSEDWPLKIIFFCLGVILGIAAVILYPRLLDREIRRQIKKMQKSGKLVYNKQITISFDDGGYTERTPDSATNSLYTTIERVGDGEGGVYLYIGAAMAHIVPASAFRSAEERGAFVAFLRERITANAPGL